MTAPATIERSRTVELGAHELLVLDDQPGTRLQVLHGGLWLTEEASLHDRFAEAGQWLQVERAGRSVAESIGASRVQVVERAPGLLPTWRDVLRRLWTRPRRFASSSVAFALALLLGVGLPEMLARSFHGAAHLAAALPVPFA